jgi:hypothetical protein
MRTSGWCLRPEDSCAVTCTLVRVCGQNGNEENGSEVVRKKARHVMRCCIPTLFGVGTDSNRELFFTVWSVYFTRGKPDPHSGYAYGPLTVRENIIPCLQLNASVRPRTVPWTLTLCSNTVKNIWSALDWEVAVLIVWVGPNAHTFPVLPWSPNRSCSHFA